ncbi:MAG TPA: hypothetical protein VLE73_04125 [Candidatus Saccharimonadales bacterium]|nr:hypothetical protein [Candidatus Saccharimonadales bacterium]
MTKHNLITSREKMRLYEQDSAAATRVGVLLESDNRLNSVMEKMQIAGGAVAMAPTARAVAEQMAQQENDSQSQAATYTAMNPDMHVNPVTEGAGA